MTGVYVDCACDLIAKGCAHPSMIVERYTRDIDACRALLRLGERWVAAYEAGERYHSIHGPGGHILGVRW